MPALEALARSRHSVEVVYTQPDRPAGRGRQPGVSAVKQSAQGLGLRVEQPANLKGDAAQQQLNQYRVDVMVVAAYGVILPQAILDVPRLGCVNIHASLLPRWRGAAPIQRAILAGDQETGISIMRMEAGLDTGPTYMRRAIAIGTDETSGELQTRLARLGADCIVDTLEALAAGQARSEDQDASAATYARKLEKGEARVDWSAAATHIARAVRAFNPRPVAETHWRSEQLRIWRARAVARDTAAAPGSVIAAAGSGIVVACGDGALVIESLQLPGKRVATAREFLNAHDVRDARFGDA